MISSNALRALGPSIVPFAEPSVDRMGAMAARSAGCSGWRVIVIFMALIAASGSPGPGDKSGDAGRRHVVVADARCDPVPDFGHRIFGQRIDLEIRSDVIGLGGGCQESRAA